MTTLLWLIGFYILASIAFGFALLVAPYPPTFITVGVLLLAVLFRKVSRSVRSRQPR